MENITITLTSEEAKKAEDEGLLGKIGFALMCQSKVRTAYAAQLKRSELEKKEVFTFKVLYDGDCDFETVRVQADKDGFLKIIPQ